MARKQALWGAPPGIRTLNQWIKRPLPRLAVVDRLALPHDVVRALPNRAVSRIAAFPGL